MLSNQHQTDLALSDIQQRLAKLINVGTVEEVDYEQAKVRIRMGEWLSAKLPWLTGQAAHDMTWQAPEVGEQVLVLAPSGDTAQGVILGSLYSRKDTHHSQSQVLSDKTEDQSLITRIAELTPETSADVQRTRYKDGALVQYDRANHRYDIFVPDTEGDEKAQINIYSGNAINIECKHDAHIKVGRDATTHIVGQTTVNIDGEASISVKDKTNVHCDKSINLHAVDELTLSSDSKVNIQGAVVDINADGAIKVNAGGQLKLNGASISAQE